jgi:hypothetical protein
MPVVEELKCKELAALDVQPALDRVGVRAGRYAPSMRLQRQTRAPNLIWLRAVPHREAPL